MTLRSILHAAVICFAAFAVVVVACIWLIGWSQEFVVPGAAVSALTTFTIMMLQKVT